MSFARPSIPEDISYIADRLRQADLDELSLYDMPAVAALTSGFNDSLQPLTAIGNGVPVAMFGVVPVLDKPASMWLLGTPELFTIKMPFLRQSQMWLDHIAKPFPSVGNWVDSRNKAHCRWLQWLGFNIADSVLIKQTPVFYYYRKNN